MENEIIEIDKAAYSVTVRRMFGENFTGVVRDVLGDLTYFKDGKWHRDDGPAVIFKSGRLSWFLFGKEYSFESWCAELNKTLEEILLLRITYGDKIE